MTDEVRSQVIAVFIDLDNVAIGVQEAKLGRFDITRVLRRLLEKGNIVCKRAYADWGRWSRYKTDLFEAGVELVEMPGGKTGKNSADIKMVVEALELSYTKPHIDVFALVSGDSDFSPLIGKLRENNKHTIGIGVKQSTSKLLIDSCDEFVLYDDLVRQQKKAKPPRVEKLPQKKREAFELLLEALKGLERENKDLHSSLVKDTMRRMQPQFNEEYHGYRSFTKLLEDAASQKLISLQKDPRSGTYVVDEVLV